MNTKGVIYEERAAAFLRAAGFEILDRNWACPLGELDIVARNKDTIAFVEVRARSNPAYGLPAETVTRAKRVKIIKTAQAWIKARGAKADTFRFDFIGITPDAGPEHIENAFNAEGFGI